MKRQLASSETKRGVLERRDGRVLQQLLGEAALETRTGEGSGQAGLHHGQVPPQDHGRDPRIYHALSAQDPAACQASPPAEKPGTRGEDYAKKPDGENAAEYDEYKQDSHR